jgi:hypothetical protein
VADRPAHVLHAGGIRLRAGAGDTLIPPRSLSRSKR